MIGVAYMTVHVAQMTGLSEIDACFDMIGVNGARSLHVDTDYGIGEGKPASLVVLDATSAFDALRYQTIPLYVISQGRVIARNQPFALTFSG
jgi:cytosine deaminase